MTIATTEHTGSALLLDQQQTFWTEQQLAGLRQIGVEDAAGGDLGVFFHVCQRTGLDPFARQIHMVSRNAKEGERWVKKWTIQTGIDGFRLIARRASDRLGETLEYEDTLWCDAEGNWTDVWVKSTPPTAAKVTVLRHGKRFPGIAAYREYVQTKRDGQPNSMWARMPSNQLAKCAEALALRKAFPQDLSGIYADEEMGQADRPERRESDATAPAADRMGAILNQTSGPDHGDPPPSERESAIPPADQSEPSGSEPRMLTNKTKFGRAFYARVAERKFETDAARLEYIVETIGRFVESTKEMTEDEARKVLARLDEEDGVSEAEVVE